MTSKSVKRTSKDCTKMIRPPLNKPAEMFIAQIKIPRFRYKTGLCIRVSTQKSKQ